MINIPAGCSSLATYYKEAKFYTKGRKHKIDTITIHCLVNQATAEVGCNYFASVDSPDKGSCNYVVGCDGSIGVSVPEPSHSYCTSNSANDDRAVTIEVASDKTYPYAVTNAAYSALIRLVADICKRNGIVKLVWSTSKEVRMGRVKGCNMTVHRDYDNKECPGQYLYERHGDIAYQVNLALSGGAINPGEEDFGPGDDTPGGGDDGGDGGDDGGGSTTPGGGNDSGAGEGGGNSYPGPNQSVVVLLDKDSIELTASEVTATEISAFASMANNFNKYEWSYTLTAIEDGKATSNDLKMLTDKTAIKEKDLVPNAAYYLEVFAETESGVKVQSPRLLICTRQDYPESISALKVTMYNNILQTGYCNISFNAPKSWGEYASKRPKKGYRISLLVNGSVRSYSDTLLVASGTTINKKISIAALINSSKVMSTDVIQLGIQSWILDEQDVKIFDSVNPVCSEPFYINPVLNLVDKLYLKQSCGFSRVVLYDNLTHK